MSRHSDPIRLAVQNLIDIVRLENEFGGQVEERLASLFDEIVGLIAKHDPSSVAERYREGRIAKIMDEVTEITGATLDDVRKALRQNLAEMGKQQVGAAASQLEATLGEVAVDITTPRMGINTFKAILDTDPLRGFTLAEWFDGLDGKVVRDVRREIRLGVANNETIDDLVRRVRGESVGFRKRSKRTGRFVGRRGEGIQVERVYSGGVLKTTTREARAIVRTGVSAIVNDAHQNLYEANADIVIGYEWVSALDSRVCEICMGLDGQVFALDNPNRKRPPDDAHINCRCTTRPIVNWEELGLEAPPEGTRSSVTYTVEDGDLVRTGGRQVAASETYQSWLRDQPNAVQNEILGPGRARLFRGGKITLRDLVKSDNQRVRLEELERAS